MNPIEVQRKLQALGINISPEMLMQMSKNPQHVEQYLKGGGNTSLLGGDIPTREQVQTSTAAEAVTPEAPKGDSGQLGTWDTAMLSIARTMPALLQLLRTMGGYAPASHFGGKPNFAVPQGIFPQRPQSRSLLASYLR